MNLADISIRRPVFATMMIAALMVFGLLAYPKVGVDTFPEVEFPIVTVSVVYPGTDPATMEREVADKIEESVNSLGGIRSLKSFNLESVTQVVIEFELEVKAEQAVQDVRDRVARIQRDLPPEAEVPVIEKFDIGAAPIMSVALAGNLPIRTLTQLADKTVKERIQRVRGVGNVDIIGGRDREIQVYIDPDKLNGLNLTFQDVARTIAAENLDVPAGSFTSGTRELTVKTKGQLKTADDVGSIVLPTLSTMPGTNPADATAQPTVRLRDVARVVDGEKEARSSSNFDGVRAVSLTVRKQTGSNAVAVAAEVRKALAEVAPQVTRQGAQLTLATDTSVYIAHSIEDVEFDLVFGAGLAILVIFFFLLNFRATLISAVAIPTSVIATFAFVHWMGFTFNNMTMLALSIAIGVLIDDAIVVMENIHRHLESGKGAFQAAADATSEIFLAVLAMTSTILAVFVPVALMKGIIGRFFMQFGLTVSFAVAMSMFVSFTLTPMMSSRLLSAHEAEGWLARIVNGLMSWMERVYGKVIHTALSHRVATLGLASLALISAGFMVTQVQKEFLPPEDRGQFQITVELPTGTSLEATESVVTALASDVRKAPGVLHTLATIGGGQQGQLNKGDIQVLIRRSTERHFTQQELMSWVRKRFASVTQAQVTISEIGMVGGGATQPIQLGLRGKDLDELAQTAEKVRAELRKIPGFVDVDTTYRGGKPEVAIHVDRDRAAALGVPVAVAAMAVRSLLAGDAATELKDGTDAIDVIVQLPEEQRGRIQSLSTLKVRSTSGQLVDLANVVSVNNEVGPSKIERSSRMRQVTVLANLDGLPLGTARAKTDEVVKRLVPGHIVTTYDGMGKIMAESFGYMIEALFLAIVLVYMILAAQFNSFVQPITIMISLPLSVIGAFGSLYMTGMTLNIFSMIGIIMLMGLVTKNAILLVDFANQARLDGTNMRDALVKAGVLRLRPILMTTVAMVFGMLPVALALGEGGAARAPMAVCVIGGLITSTLLTLVVVPVVYTLFDGLVNSRVLRYLSKKVFTHDPVAEPEGRSAS